MRYGLALVTTLAWGLWLGGLMALFLSVSHLFHVDRELAKQAAPQIFIVFERYQIALATVALIASATWRLTTPRTSLTVLFSLFALCAVGSIIQTTIISSKMHHLREIGQSSGEQFMRLHGFSMAVYSSQAVLLLIAAFALISGMQARSAPIVQPMPAAT